MKAIYVWCTALSSELILVFISNKYEDFLVIKRKRCQRVMFIVVGTCRALLHLCPGFYGH